MLKLIHGADFHLDAPFAALTAAQAIARRAEQRLLLERLADLCDRERADLVFLSGDLLDGERVYRETAEALARTLGSIRAQVFLTPGNHDFYGPRGPYANLVWPENVHIFTSETVEAVPLPALGCTVYGSAFTAPFRDSSPLAGFTAPAGELSLMCVHGDVDGVGRYGSITRREIAESGLTYLALGHVHACSGARTEGATVWAYPGCPEGRGFDELGDKGVLVGTVDDAHRVTLDFVPLCLRRYQSLTVDVSGGAEAALRAALSAGSKSDICRILLTGESDGLDLAALEELARGAFYQCTLRDKTTVRRDLWSRAEEDTLTGLFLREMRARLDAAGEESERDALEQAVRFGLAALEQGEDCCP